MLSKFLKKNKGLTLIEFVIVVVMIGILVAVAVPRFKSKSANYRSFKVEEDLRKMRKAQVDYESISYTYWDFSRVYQSPAGGNSIYIKFPDFLGMDPIFIRLYHSSEEYTITFTDTTFLITYMLRDDNREYVISIDQDKKLINEFTDRK